MNEIRRDDLINELLIDVAETIKDKDTMYFPTNFELESNILKTNKFKSIASDIVDEIINERQNRGITKSKFNDELYNKLMDGNTIVWSDVTGVVSEEQYQDEIDKLENIEKNLSDTLKNNLIKVILNDLAIKNNIINGYFFSNNKNALLLPKLIKDLKFYETEDIYDYISVDVIDEVKGLFVCIANDGAKMSLDTHNTNYVGTLIDADGTDLLGIKRSKDASDNITFVGELLISENDIGR